MFMGVANALRFFGIHYVTFFAGLNAFYLYVLS